MKNNEFSHENDDIVLYKNSFIVLFQIIYGMKLKSITISYL